MAGLDPAIQFLMVRLKGGLGRAVWILGSRSRVTILVSINSFNQ
jgi:hypothetical protein